MACWDISSWWSTNWTAVFAYSRAALAPMIAIVTVYIAWQQWQTNRNKMKLDLYDRRFKAFSAIRDFLGKMYTSGTDQATLFQFVTQTQEVRFLFDEDIDNYAKEVWRHANQLADARNQLSVLLQPSGSGPQEERKRLAEIEKEEVNWAQDQSGLIGSRFKKFLDLSKL